VPDVATVIGSAIRSTAEEFGWSQRELARRLTTNQSAIRRLQAGGATIDSALATSALDLLGIRLTIDANPIGLAGRRQQRDAVHARCCGYVARELKRRGWDVRTEVEIGEGRYRGWIDILAYRPSDGALLVIEVKTVIDDFGRILRTVGWYVRSSREAASSFGWRPRRIVPVLIALATVDTDARLIANADLIRNDMPGGALDLAPWIDDAATPPPQPSLALIDPLSRRRTWLLRARLAGRRTPAPYRDYRDAAERLASARASRPRPPVPPPGRRSSS